jgi:hypothetical protein
MIKYDPKTETVEMDLVNLEHCGFDRFYFGGELFLNGIDNEKANNPKILIVNFRGAGHKESEKKPEELRR